MPAAGRLGDKSYAPTDTHGMRCCSHAVIGPSSSASANVAINAKPALRVTDRGVHDTCCGQNRWVATKGSESVLINNLPAHRLDDETAHCGGHGNLIEGSPNVMIGGPRAQVRPPRTAKHKLAVRILHEDGEALANEPYELLDENGSCIRSGHLDANGLLCEHDIPAGNYRMRLQNGWFIKL